MPIALTGKYPLAYAWTSPTCVSTTLEDRSVITLTRLVTTAALVTTVVCAGYSKTQSSVQADGAPATSKTLKGDQKTMQIYYLEIVTKEVDAVCATYAATNGVQFGKPDAALGNA